ncbi:MAG: 50S ribosomal protein L11 methyltransferase [Bacteroidetes bacterium]|nr:MAG: 50S ribosomal protein L11 methyltransferase [Bacteroidota bacterium]
MSYFEFEIPTRSWSDEQKEILLAKMWQIGFEGFTELDGIIQAYIEKCRFSASVLNRMIDDCGSMGIRVQYRYHELEEQNWNLEWESRFRPVVIGGSLLVRASFHDDSKDLPHTIVIDPKMSFGTGHHHTTRMMIQEMMELDLSGKSVLDLGCGTGILGIYAAMKGAGRVLGIDNDQWAYQNALENVARNNVDMEVRLGDLECSAGERFDYVLANITRNVLVHSMPSCAGLIRANGMLLVSGILAEEVQFILNAAYREGLKHLHTREESNWLALTFIC